MSSCYVELQVASAFSFLRGASMPEELMARAAELGYRSIGLTDHNGLYGVVRADQAAKAAGIRLWVGAELHFEGLPEARFLVYPQDRAAYGRLTRALSLGRLQAGKNGFRLGFSDWLEASAGQLCILKGRLPEAEMTALVDTLGDRLYIGLGRDLAGQDRTEIEAAQAQAARFRLPSVALGGVLMHEAARKPLQDILTCLRHRVRLREAGRRLLPNAMGQLKSPAQMARLFADFPDAIAATQDFVGRLEFSLDQLSQRFWMELLPDGQSADQFLAQRVKEGAKTRYPGGIPEAVCQQIRHELQLIASLDFAGYFITVWDIVRFARSRGILCQGRGSAANSVVCYCLGITAIDPVQMALLFERFISAERGEPPDIDVDFEHHRREEVMQYVFQKYGREHAAMVANFISFRGKSAIRELGFVFGLDDGLLGRLSRVLGHRSVKAMSAADLAEAGVNAEDPGLQSMLYWAGQLEGFPRHLGMHSGGFVVTRDPLVELVPIERASMAGRTVIAWDKRDIEALKLVKVDLLALGMLTAIQKCFELLKTHTGRELSLWQIPSEEASVYRMISDADTIGCFQIESRAQMQLLPRLQPKTFYDLVVSVAIVRPGPIQGQMVHPYLRRRNGEEPITWPHPALKEILGKTYGVPLFQEQIMKMAVAVAGFTPGEADELRRAIGFRSTEKLDELRERIVRGMQNSGLSSDFASRIYDMIRGFGGYGFPESHAASFALISYASAFLKRHHPAAFVCGLLNSQPMGFYSPNTLLQSAKRHGVMQRSLSVQHSLWDFSLEPGDPKFQAAWYAEEQSPEKRHTPYADRRLGQPVFGDPVQPALRIGFRAVAGLSKSELSALFRAREEAPFRSLQDCLFRSALGQATALRLAAAGAFDDFGLDRRQAAWQVLSAEPRGSLFESVESQDTVQLPPQNAVERLASDYQSTGLSIGPHPVALFRAWLKREGYLSSADLRHRRHGQLLRVAGLITLRQRPATAKGVVFMSLEDEFGVINLVVYEKVYLKQKALAEAAGLLLLEGRLERSHPKVLNLVVKRFLEGHPGNPPRWQVRHFH